MFRQYAELGVDCVLLSAYADDAMFGIQAQGYAASHSYWVGVSVPTQMSGGLSSRLIAPNGEVQSTAIPPFSGLAVDLLDEGCLRWEIALHRAKPWRARAREGSIYRPGLRPGPAKRSEIELLNQPSSARQDARLGARRGPAFLPRACSPCSCCGHACRRRIQR